MFLFFVFYLLFRKLRRVCRQCLLVEKKQKYELVLGDHDIEEDFRSDASDVSHRTDSVLSADAGRLDTTDISSSTQRGRTAGLEVIGSLLILGVSRLRGFYHETANFNEEEKYFPFSFFFFFLFLVLTNRPDFFASFSRFLEP